MTGRRLVFSALFACDVVLYVMAAVHYSGSLLFFYARVGSLSCARVRDSLPWTPLPLRALLDLVAAPSCRVVPQSLSCLCFFLFSSSFFQNQFINSQDT